jgi:hypothetical protein
MTHSLFRLLLLSLISVALWGQTPPEVAAEFAKSPAPPPSNQVVGIDIDRYIGSPAQHPVRTSHGVILLRSILTSGDPYGPGAPGAVLEYRKDLAYGTVLGHNQTPLVEIPEQLFLYIESGKGRVENDSEYWGLREGVAVLIPPRVKHRLVNTSDEQLQMIVLLWNPDPAATPGKAILVRDINTVPFHACGDQPCHWSYWGKNIFNSTHGLHPNEGFHLVHVPPMSIGEPHAHVRKWEEVWVKLGPDDSYLTLGSEIREMPVHTAFLAPPNYKTVHAVINLRKDRPQKWLFISHFIVKQSGYSSGPLVSPKSLRDLNRSTE